MTPLCFGVCCERHGQCARYLAVEGAGSEPRIGTCGPARPLFIPIQPAKGKS